MKISFVIDNLGPYHIARLNAISKYSEVFVIEVRGKSLEYDWLPAESVTFQRVTLMQMTSGKVPQSALFNALNTVQPHVVFTSGWSGAANLAALLWSGQKKVPVIVMTESQEIDFPRQALVEWVKRRVLSHVSGAFAGGVPHAAYARALGIPGDSMRLGYDVVDNDHFTTAPSEFRRGFLASARFIGKKNLPFLLRAHATYRRMHRDADPTEMPWELTILGDGSTRHELESLSRDLGGGVNFRGFLQYQDLPAVFANAGAFVHVSTTEQWGLVVNEAMAAGLPVLVSSRCGCAFELVKEGENGYSIDPYDEIAWASRMYEIATLNPQNRKGMGEISQSIIKNFTPETHARAAMELVNIAMSRPIPHLYFINKYLIKALAWWQKY